MGGSTTTVQKNTPYQAAKPLLDQGLGDAKAMYDAGGFNISPFDGQRVAGFDPLRQATIDQTAGVVSQGLGAANTAYGAAQAAMDPTQWRQGLDQVRDNVIADVMPAINGTFAGSGMTGSSLHQTNLADGLASGLGEVYYGAQNAAQNRALQAAGMLPSINAGATGLLGFQDQVGQGRQQYEQGVINSNMQADQQAKTAELAALQDYLNIANGVGSTFGTSSATSKQSMGLGGQGAVVETFASSDTGTWTITVTMPNGMTCMIASGQSFEALIEALPPKEDDA